MTPGKKAWGGGGTVSPGKSMGEYCHPRLKGGGGVCIVTMTPGKSMGGGGYCVPR